MVSLLTCKHQRRAPHILAQELSQVGCLCKFAETIHSAFILCSLNKKCHSLFSGEEERGFWSSRTWLELPGVAVSPYVCCVPVPLDFHRLVLFFALQMFTAHTPGVFHVSSGGFPKIALAFRGPGAHGVDPRGPCSPPGMGNTCPVCAVLQGGCADRVTDCPGHPLLLWGVEHFLSVCFPWGA